MSEEPFLILHKVRGVAAFDIAQKLMIGDEEAWIIPTSGHRAYPYWTSPTPIDDILYCYGKFIPTDTTMPDDLPDHYASNDRPIRSEPASDFVRNLVNRMLPKMRRI